MLFPFPIIHMLNTGIVYRISKATFCMEHCENHRIIIIKVVSLKIFKNPFNIFPWSSSAVDYANKYLKNLF